MATFITSKPVNEFINILVDTSTGYWKYNHNGTDFGPFPEGEQSVEVLNANGEFTLISCLSDGTPSGDFANLHINNSEITSFDASGLSTLLFDLQLNDNNLTSLDVSSLSGLIYLEAYNNNLTSINVVGLSNLTNLQIYNNNLTSLDVTGLNNIHYLTVNGNYLTPENNDDILAHIVSTGILGGGSYNFTTAGGRTSAGTADYNTLIARGWILNGLGLITAPTWYRFKALGTNWTGWNSNNGLAYTDMIKQSQYQLNGYTYFDFQTTYQPDVIYFTAPGEDITATQVPVTFQQSSSSGSFISGQLYGGAITGYAFQTPFGNAGTLVSGQLPALAVNGNQLPAGAVVFANVSGLTPVPLTILTLQSPNYLLSLTLNGDVIDVSNRNSSLNGTTFTPPLGYFVNGEETTFSLTWGELVETPPASSGKLRIKGALTLGGNMQL